MRLARPRPCVLDISARIVLLALGSSLATSARAGSSFQVGTFQKTIASAPAVQTVPHGLGVAPKAIILWTNARTNELVGVHYRLSFGFTDGTSAYSVSTASQDGDNAATESDCSRRIAARALTVVEWPEATIAEANATGWDAASFTLTWTVNNAVPFAVHYIAIGGTDVSARAHTWTMPTVTGNRLVTGIGFQPDAVLFAHAGSGFTNPIPSSIEQVGFGLGAFDTAGRQWANTIFCGTGSAQSDTQRCQLTNAALVAINVTPAIVKRASFVSVNGDGYTLNFTTTNGNASRVVALALKGVNVRVQNFLKSTAAAPAAQTIAGIGFAPSLVFLTSMQDLTRANPVAQGRLGLGASDGTSEASSAAHDANNLAVTSADGIDKASKVFVKINNNAQLINAEADFTSMNPDGFTLNWSTNDGAATQMLYLALGSLAPTAITLGSVEAGWRPDGVLIEWRTGYEVDNLGFHVHREENGLLRRLTRSPLAGCALLGGCGTPFAAGGGYRFLDREGSDSARYWLEDIDLGGKRTLHGPIVPVANGAAAQAAEISPSLAAMAPAAPLRPRQAEVRAPPASVSVPDEATRRATQILLASMPAVKLVAREEGWYRASGAELAAAGFDLAADPRLIQLFVDGAEVPIRLIGLVAGRLTPESAVEFYGTGQETPSSDARVHWLIAGATPGKRIRAELRMPAAEVEEEERSFPYTIELREREIYFAALKNGDEENFFGPVITTEGADQTFLASSIDPQPPLNALLEVSVQGVTDATHRLRFLLNGIQVRDLVFSGRDRASAEVALSHARLREGENRLEVLAEGGEDDVSLLDSVHLTYWRRFVAEGDALRCPVEGGRPLTLRGFSSPRILVADVTDTASVFLRLGEVVADGEGFAVKLPAGRAGLLYAFCEDRASSPASIEANKISRWNEPQPGAGLVIISHGDLVGALAPLRALREAEGWTVAVVDVADIYDEFGFGARDPNAIRSFLQRARGAWGQKPSAALLVGDSSFDPRNYLGRGDWDLVPTKLVDTDYLETASDDWFADFDGDGLAEIPVGRLPVRTRGEAERVVSKIVARAQAPAGEAWRREVLIVADASDGFDFEGAARELTALLPSTWTAREVYRGRGDDASVRAAVREGIEEGKSLVNYVGHGSVEVWRGEILTSSSARRLKNGSRLPIVITMNCLNGFFHDLHTESLAEALLLAEDGGAAAVWAPSSLTTPQQQALMNRELMRWICPADGSVGGPTGTPTTLGEAVQAAKAAARHVDLRRTWILFGDPCMRVGE